jgi:hypothetical protein
LAETNLWTWLKPYCPRGQYTRVENGEVGPGTPDVHYRVPGCTGWIELKDARSKNAKIPFPNPDVGLHKSQIRWIGEHVLYGGTVWIVPRIGKLILFIPGKYYSSFNGATLTRLQFLSKLAIDMTDPAPSLKKLKQLLETPHDHPTLHVSRSAPSGKVHRMR